MAKRVFFCFHYKDVIDFRANVVRNHWLTKNDREDAGFFDASLWENTKRKGEESLKRLINNGLNGTSSTCVLIGSQTYSRTWVRYEILKSMKRGNKLFGVHINGIRDKHGYTKDLGNNPFDYLGIKYNSDGTKLTMYEWKNGKWVEYSKIDGSSTYILEHKKAEKDWGKFYQLSKHYPVYKWNEDNGFNNFSKWVG
jgi:hypothetical protein